MANGQNVWRRPAGSDAPRGGRRGNPNPSKETMPPQGGYMTPPPPMKKGGKIKKTAVYKLHKGETVVPARKAKKRR